MGKVWSKSPTRLKLASLTRSLFSASFQTFCSTARPYLNTQKYGLFCSVNGLNFGWTIRLTLSISFFVYFDRF